MPSFGHGRIYGADTATIVLNAVEIQNLSNFVVKHNNCQTFGNWPIRFSVNSTSNGIGDSINVKCMTCGEIAHISDMDSW